MQQAVARSHRRVATNRPDDEREARINRFSGAVVKNLHDAGYFSKTLVPRIFWLLSVPRKSGTMRSINSK